MESEELLKKRFIELWQRSEGGYFTFTDFLGLLEQSILSEVQRSYPGMKYSAFGGCEGCERVMVRFGDEEELGYSEQFPIVCIKAEPVSQKFADKLTHRDFLGALLNLGIERETLGDIPILDNVGYVFCKRDISEHILTSLSRVKHTDVRLSICDNPPEGGLYKTERRRVQALGERVDAVVAKVFCISREEASLLFKRGLVFVNGRGIESPSHIPKRGEIISVRGYGRMRYLGYDSLSKKGKKNIEVDLFI
jgi:RNA-binding protein YlmH